MSRRNRTWLRSSLWSVACLGIAHACGSAALGSTILLKDGRTLQGRLGKTAGLAENPLKPEADGPPTITFVDNDLRREFVPTFRIAQVLEADMGEVPERISIHQHVARNGSRVQRVGPIVNIEPFDDKGRRTLTMMTDKGPLKVIQGITLITPLWTKVEGMATRGRTPLVWDMRISTSSIPTETLAKVLAGATNPKVLDQRLKLVKLLMQADRYKDAQKELQDVIKDFPDQKDLAREVQALRQLHARSIVAEIETRKKAGQHALAYALLEKFPAQDIAGETLQQVKELLDEYKADQKKLETAYNDLKAQIATIKDSPRRLPCEALLDEMGRELGINSLNRLADYLRLADDKALGAEQKVSLALSGWLLGANQADTNLAVTLSLAKVREVIRRYLNEPVKLEREKQFAEFGALEGASPALIAGLIANMKPPIETPAPSPGKPGFYQLEVPIGITDEPNVTYYVQLPPQYDPYVRYPTIVTLNGAGTSPEQQIDWWAGAPGADGGRLGQATRLGYIVIAIDWLNEGQTEYGFSAREHAAVLVSLRDACRRFSIDTDRVYLSGHSVGGNAAWDLGLAHPDLWAGVIPIVALAEKYCSLYWENAGLVPFYFVAGEMDGDKTIQNAHDLDRYMIKRFDVTVVEYIGRGHEDFYEDIQNIFDWMSRRRRNFFPKEFTVATMRTWDNYFWWFEGRDFPSRAMVDPVDWPPARGVRPVEIVARLTANNGISINTAAVKSTLWLSPEVVDFTRRVPITINGRTIKSGGQLIEPDVGVLLEDVRTRADRQHPFWAKLEN